MATAMTGARRRGQKRAAAKVKVSTHVEGGPGGIVGDGNWKVEQKKRLTAQVAALEKELKDFDPVAAAAKVRAGLDLELRRTKLRLEQNELEDL